MTDNRKILVAFYSAFEKTIVLIDFVYINQVSSRKLDSIINTKLFYLLVISVAKQQVTVRETCVIANCNIYLQIHVRHIVYSWRYFTNNLRSAKISMKFSKLVLHSMEIYMYTYFSCAK